MSDIVIYENGNVELKTTVENESIWLSQKQMEILFGRERSVISKHIRNIFKEGELEEKVVCAIEGKTQSKEIKIYNLDVIISVGYRVKSKQGTQFRIWANKVLKEYLLKGYDEQSLQEVLESKEEKFILDYDEAKSANLLYYIIKGHPFNDGNKRIGAYLFILFLHKNGILHKPDGESKINDNALASIALLVAQSDPSQKDIIIKLVMNMLYDGDV